MNRRNSTVCFGGAIVLVGAMLFAVAQAEDQKPAPSSDSPSQQLLERLEKLEARIAQLEQRAALPPAYPTQAVPPLSRVIPPLYSLPPGPPASVPEGATPREFNGIRYYIVPLDGSVRAK